MHHARVFCATEPRRRFHSIGRGTSCVGTRNHATGKETCVLNKRLIITALIVIAAALGACLLILATNPETAPPELIESLGASAVPSLQATPIPAETPTPELTVEPTPEPTAEPTIEPEPTPEPTVEPTPVPTPVPVAQPTEATGLGYGFPIDLDGDGFQEDVVFDPASLSPTGTIQITIDGVTFDTAIPQGTGGSGMWVGDVDVSDGYQELFLQVVQDFDSDLYVYRYEYGTLVRAMTTYTLPAYLSPSGTDELLYDADSIVFYGVHPILVMGDGSFGLLYGDSFTMFLLDGDLHFTEIGTQPADIISGGASGDEVLIPELVETDGNELLQL